MKTIGTTAILAMAAALALGASAHAATITYAFTGGSKTATVTAPDIQAGDIALHGGWAVSSGTGMAYINAANSIGGTDESSAVTAGDYFDFTITPAAGYSLNLSSLAFNYALTSGGAASGTVTYFVRSDAESATFATTLFASPPANFAGTTGAWHFANANQTLGPAYQNLTAPTTFRIYVYMDNYVTDGSDYARLDNLVLNGAAAAVPEPATLGLLGLGAMALIAKRRRRA